jgi:hypothetical protein
MQRRQFFYSSFMVGLSSFGLATQLSAQTSQRLYDKYREPPLSEDALKKLPASRDEHSGIPIRTSIKNLNLKYRDAPRMPGFPAG